MDILVPHQSRNKQEIVSARKSVCANLLCGHFHSRGNRIGNIRSVSSVCFLDIVLECFGNGNRRVRHGAGNDFTDVKRRARHNAPFLMKIILAMERCNDAYLTAEYPRYPRKERWAD